jgi:hypothetical protein
MTKLPPIVLLLFITAGIAAPESGRQSFGLNERATAQAWSAAQNVKIDEPVFAYISEGFQSHAKELGTLDSDHKWQGKDYTVGETLVGNYLCNVRDVKYSAQTGPGPVPWTRDPGSMLGEKPSATFQTGFAIGMADVKRYTVDKFFDDIRHLEGQKIGELKVSSTPTGGIITLDGNQRGLTFRVSAESAGDHPIRVEISGGLITCSETITIPAGGSVSYRCPKN